MAQKMTGLDFLNEHQIRNMTCRMDEPFAFISYSHDDNDVVGEVFSKLHQMGYNLWIDTANLPKDQNSWTWAASDAIRLPQCKMAFFFRSETSMVKNTILDELELIGYMDKKIIVVDIWNDFEDIFAFKRWVRTAPDKREEEDTFRSICNLVNINCNAIRLKKDMGGDRGKLAAEMARWMEINGIKRGTTIHVPPPVDGTSYFYRILGQKYTAGPREQGKILYDTFEALIAKDPANAQRLTERTSVARAETVSGANTGGARPTYFRICKEYQVNGQAYLVGISYSFEDKVREAKRMLKTCGEDPGSFALETEPSQTEDLSAGQGGQTSAPVSNGEKDTPDTGKKGSDPVLVGNTYQYRLWDRTYSAEGLNLLMHQFFDQVAEKYPAQICALSDAGTISCVAPRADVDNGTLADTRKNYFRAKKLHRVNQKEIYLGTSFGRDGAIAQMKKILKQCEGTDDAFVLLAAPEKGTRSSEKKPKNGKMSLSELLLS